MVYELDLNPVSQTLLHIINEALKCIFIYIHLYMSKGTIFKIVSISHTHFIMTIPECPKPEIIILSRKTKTSACQY